MRWPWRRPSVLAARSEPRRPAHPPRRDPAERLFWARALQQVVELDGVVLRAALLRISGVELEHPFLRRRRFSRPELERHLDDARDVVRLIDRLFWCHHLQPLLEAEGNGRARGLAELAHRPLQHPLRGPVRVQVDELLERLEAVRATDQAALQREVTRLFGPDIERRLPAGHVGSVRYADPYALVASRLGLDGHRL